MNETTKVIYLLTGVTSDSRVTHDSFSHPQLLCVCMAVWLRNLCSWFSGLKKRIIRLFKPNWWTEEEIWRIEKCPKLPHSVRSCPRLRYPIQKTPRILLLTKCRHMITKFLVLLKKAYTSSVQQLKTSWYHPDPWDNSRSQWQEGQ